MNSLTDHGLMWIYIHYRKTEKNTLAGILLPIRIAPKTVAAATCKLCNLQTYDPQLWTLGSFFLNIPLSHPIPDWCKLFIAHLPLFLWLVVSTPLKNMSQNGFIFPNFRGENNKYLKFHHLVNIYSCLTEPVDLWTSFWCQEKKTRWPRPHNGSGKAPLGRLFWVWSLAHIFTMATKASPSSWKWWDLGGFPQLLMLNKRLTLKNMGCSKW